MPSKPVVQTTLAGLPKALAEASVGTEILIVDPPAVVTPFDVQRAVLAAAIRYRRSVGVEGDVVEVAGLGTRSYIRVTTSNPVEPPPCPTNKTPGGLILP